MHEDDALLSIGGLAATSGLSPKALRLYDESGLLPPRRIDPFTGYRSYGQDQVERARLIARLRGIGMGLERIRAIADLPAPAAAGEIRAWWLQEQADVRSRGEAVQGLLTSFARMTEGDGMGTTDQTPRAGTSRPIQVAVELDRGRARSSQQDAVLIEDGADRTLLAVADGFGDDAIADRCLRAFAEGFTAAITAQGTGVNDALEAGWAEAEAVIRTETRQDVGTTLTATVIDGDRLHVAHIGDARVLLVRAGTSPSGIEVVTQDHTHVRSLLAAGRLTPEEAAQHPDRAVLNRALAAGAPTAPDLVMRRISSGDRIALVTDGVHGVLEPGLLADALLDRVPGAHRSAEGIARSVLDAGAPDNLAVLIADIG